MKSRASFISNPFQFTSRLLGKRGSGRLSCKKEEIESYLERVHSDPNREEELGSNDKLLIPEEPSTEFDESEPKLKEVADIMKKARAASALGPNSISYKVYKTCPRLWKQL